MDSLCGDGLTIHKQLNALMHNKYLGDIAKLTKWLTVSRIQRPGSGGGSAKPPAPAPKA